jgi:predicted dehydrogenase
MPAKLPFAVVGCGYWGSKHIRVAYETQSLEIALAVDSRQERLDYVKQQYPGVNVSRDFASVLDSDVAGVIIATPISAHYPLAKAALLAGKHVLVEKPLTMASDQCLELISIAEQRDLVLMVGHTFEYHPAVVLTRDLIQQGRLGELYHVSSRRLNLGLYRLDANVLWDLAPHDLSIIFFLMEAELQSIGAWGFRHVLPNTEDVVYANLALTNGATAHFHVSWLDPVKVRDVTVVGSEGMLVFDDIAPVEKVRIYEKRFKPVPSGDSFADFQSAYRHGNVYIPELAQGEPLQLEVADFARAIRTGTQPRAGGRSALRVVRALESASLSLAQAPQNGWGRHAHVFTPDRRRSLGNDGGRAQL